MGQLITRLPLMLILVLAYGCGRGSPAPATQPSHAKPVVVSVVPAATDLILSMGAGDHLAGVSNFEPQAAAVKDLPRVGDYHGVDWERVAQIRPDILITSRSEKDLAPTFLQRAASLNVRIVTVHIDRLDDIFAAITTVGDALAEQRKAAELAQRLRQRLDAVRQRVAGRPLVPALIVLDEQHTFIAGSKNYLDDVLAIAGGTNLAATMNKDYPTVDAELILKLNPAAVIQLLPESPEQVVQSARARWAKLPALEAVRGGRVSIFTDPYLLLPSAHVADVCEKFEQALHPAR